MGVPKRKTSKMKRRQRQASHKRPFAGSRDPKTGSWHQPHRVDPKTGMYGGRQVIIISADE